MDSVLDKPKPIRKWDITNKRFGKLVAKECIGRVSGGYLWKCECDCGNITNSTVATLNSGKSSCGCLKNQVGDKAWNWQGHGRIGLSFWNRIRHHAKNRNIPFDLSIEYAWKLFESQNGICALSGREIDFGRSHRKGNTASLDRIDSDLGYFEGNVWWLHKDINYIKMDFTVCEILSMVKDIYEYQRKHS